MKVLIIGASGFLGEKLFTKLSSEYEVYGTYLNRKKERLFNLDLRDKENLKKVVKKLDPSVIINSSGIINVDYCEENLELVMRNSILCIKNLIDICLKNKCKLLHISTDYVFDGKKGDYKEEDKSNPINVYGTLKLEEENIVKLSDVDFLISRVSVLYGYNSPNDKQTFVNWVIKSLKNKDEIKVINDQYTTPTLIDDIAEALKILIKLNKTGIYHVAGSECINRYDFAIKIADIFGLKKDLIIPTTSDEINWKAKRPMNSCLNIDKLKNLGVKMSNVDKGLSKMKKQMGFL